MATRISASGTANGGVNVSLKPAKLDAEDRPFLPEGTKVRLRIPSKDDPEKFEWFKATVVGIAKAGQHRVYICDAKDDAELLASLDAAGYEYEKFCMHETELELEVPDPKFKLKLAGGIEADVDNGGDPTEE